MSGEYAIVNCGANAKSVVTMLETLWGALIQATQDSESSNMSPAYQTFFKDPENMAFVSNILAQSSAGAAIHPPTRVNNGAPVIMCLSAAGQLAGSMPDGSRFDAYNSCRQSPTLSAQSLSGTPYIGLCPYFWDSGLGTIAPVPLVPPLTKCLSVNAKNKFNLDRLGRAGPTLTQYGMWILLEEIVHIYLIPEQTKSGLLNQMGDYEVYDANDVLALSADHTLMNAHSYLLYAASKFPLAGCYLSAFERMRIDVERQAYTATAPISQAHLVHDRQSVYWPQRLQLMLCRRGRRSRAIQQMLKDQSAMSFFSRMRRSILRV